MGSFSSGQHLGSWQPFLSYKTGTITSSGVAKVLWYRLAWSWCLVFGNIRNSLVLLFFVVTWAVLFDFWASGLTIHTLFPLSIQQARRFTKYPAGFCAAFCILLITSSVSLPFLKHFALVRFIHL